MRFPWQQAPEAAAETDFDDVQAPPPSQQADNAGTGGTSDVTPPPQGRAGDGAEPHPVLTAALAAGIDTPAKFAALTALAADGRAFADVLGKGLQHEAVRLFGQEKGPKRASALAHLPAADRAEIADEWQAQADEKFGIGKERQAPPRQSTPPDPNADPTHPTGGSNDADEYLKQRNAAADACPNPLTK